MPYYNREDVYRQFTKEINNQADAQIENLKKQISETKEKNLKRIDNELKSSIYRSMEYEIREMNAEHSGNLNRVKTEYSKVLMTEKSRLLDSIITAAKEKCLEFVGTTKYKTLMTKLVKKIDSDFNKKKVEFRIKKADSVLIEVIKSNFKSDFEIKEINEIEIGGFLAICFDAGLMVDETIDHRLDEKQKWFYEHSELAAK
jgi:vacuolar-type H+-ATPase subunit E/Vma4